MPVPPRPVGSVLELWVIPLTVTSKSNCCSRLTTDTARRGASWVKSASTTLEDSAPRIEWGWNRVSASRTNGK